MNMSKIELDYNFQPNNLPDDEQTEFYNVEEPPFSIYGLPNGFGNRISENLDVPLPVIQLGRNSTGGRIRFRTNSEYVKIVVSTPIVHQMPHMPKSGILGCDMYVKEKSEINYVGTFMPPRYASEICNRGGYEAKILLGSQKERDIIINLPLYNPVSDVSIGFKSGSTLSEGSGYKNKKPIVFYGSSITQGGCASRPGNCYEALLSRWFDTDYINLGFSGYAKAEPDMAEYIADMDMSAFVFDYDNNSPDADYLRKTHKPMFDIIREKHPELPIIFASRPKTRLKNEEVKQRNVILSNYQNEKQAGDKNVYFADGTKMFEGFGGDNCCTVDGNHPNDLGFFAMAKTFSKILEEIGFEKMMDE